MNLQLKRVRKAKGLLRAFTRRCRSWGSVTMAFFLISTVLVAVPLVAPKPASAAAIAPMIAAGGGFTCALAYDGTVKCSGANSYGQLGDSTTTSRLSPVAVTMPAGVKFTSLTAGREHACALTATGTAYCWGRAYDGRLGDGGTTDRLAPVAVTMPGGVTFTSLAAGVHHSCGLATTGAAYCWGANWAGQVGDGTGGPDRTIPVAVTMPGGVTFTSVTGGAYHSCGLATTGAAYCWGANWNSQLGDSTTTNRTAPVAVTMPGGVTFTSLAPGVNHSCALATTGAAYCWGYNVDGRLGDGTTTDRTMPVAVTMPGGVTFESVASGEWHSCALAPTGAAYCWGRSVQGQLGDGPLTDRRTPSAVTMPGGVTFSAIATGDFHSCGLATTGAAYCWGSNIEGQLGDGTVTDRTTPVAIVMPGGVTFTAIAAGDNHTCGLATTSAVAYCWGKNSAGQLGDGTTTDRTTPVAVSMPGGVTFTSLAGGYFHSCGLATTGAAYCWGDNSLGQLGDGTTNTSTTPVAVTMPGGVTFTSVVAGAYHTCARATTGAAYCWGFNFYGQAGNSTNTNSTIPVAVTMPGGVTFASLTGGAYHSCAVATTTAVAYCWGANWNGQVGDSSTTHRNAPVAVTMPGGVTFTSIAGGDTHSCALAATTAVAYCWGANWAGQVGDGTNTERTAPVAVTMPGGVTFTSLGVGAFQSCGVATTGAAYCWGWNDLGLIGDGTTVDRYAPVAVTMPGGVTFTSFAGGNYHSCARTTTGTAYCWGNNGRGQLGSGGLQNPTVPVITGFSTGMARISQTGSIFENDDEDEATGDAFDENTPQAGGATALTGVKAGERLNARIQLKNSGGPLSSVQASAFYDRNDGIFTKVRKRAPVVTAAGNCTDTNYSCEAIETTGDVGRFSSTAIDPAGNAWVSYLDATNYFLKVARYVGSGGTGCASTAWTCTAVDASFIAGQQTSIAFSPSGVAWISYHEGAAAEDLKVARFVGSGGTGCTGSTEWTCTLVDSTSATGYITTIAFSSDGNPVISYQDFTSLNLRFASYVTSGGTGCGGTTIWTCTTIDSASDVYAPQMAVNAAGVPWVSYLNGATSDLKVATYVGSGGLGCATTAWTCTTVDSTGNLGFNASIAFDPAGNPWISYHDHTVATYTLKVARYVGTGGTGCATNGWTCTTVDDSSTTDSATSIAFDVAGNAWVAYRSSSNVLLRVARYVGGSSQTGCASSTAWACGTVGTTTAMGTELSLAFDHSGNAWISYRDDSAAQDLRIARFSRGGEIQIGTSLAGDTGDALNESHADMTNATDTANRDDADCVGGGAWNNGAFSEAESISISLPNGSSTAQCTEVAFAIDTSNARANTTYRLLVATKDGVAPTKGMWRGPTSVTTYPTLTTETTKSTRIAKDASAVMANCTDTAWGCGAVDTARFGNYSSMAMDAAGNPWISYTADLAGTRDLFVTHYVGSGGTGCATAAWSCTTVDSALDIMYENSLAIDATGVPWITYYDYTNAKVKVARYVGSGGTGCAVTSWTCIAVHGAFQPSIGFDFSGTAWISYDDGVGGLGVARYVGSGGTGCNSSTEWMCTLVESTTNTGLYSSLAFDRAGNPWVSSYDNVGLNLRVARYVGTGGTGCAVTSWTCEAIDTANDVGAYRTSIAFDGQGAAWISYRDETNADLRVARYVGAGGTGCAVLTWTCLSVDTAGDVGRASSIAIDAAGNPWISHATFPFDLRITRYVGGTGGTGCAGSTAWTCVSVDSPNDVGDKSSIAFDSAGVPWVSYTDYTTATLRVAKMHSAIVKPVTTTGIATPGRSASRSDGRYLLDLGDAARPFAGTCDAASGRTGYCGVASSDAALDGITAKANERPQYVMSAVSATNTGAFTLSWTGRSTSAPSALAVSMEVWRGGTTNAWQTVTLSANTCSAAGASTDCTMVGGISTNLSDYYDTDGAAYRVHARVAQAANASGTETLSTNVLSMTAGVSNTAPSSPSSLLQKTTGDVVLSTGAWNNSTSVKFTATVTDTDATDTNSLCVEVKALGVAFTNAEDACGSAITQGGTASVTSVLTNGTEYHWQVRSKDAGGLYSPWVSYDVNAETARDVGIDLTAPTTGTVYDGLTSGVDSFQNNGSLTALSANWDGFSDAASGITNYDYAIGTTQGGIDIKTWTAVTTSTSVTANTLSLATSIVYYFSVRATDGAGNVATVIYSNGQNVAPVLVFAVASVGAAASCGDATTTVASTTTGFDLGRLTNISQHPIAGQSLAVTTNGAGGYSVYLSYFGPLTGASSARLLTNTASTNASPAVWPADGTEAFGYATSSSTLSGTATRFRTNKWARPDTVNAEIMRSTTPVPAGETACLAVQASQAGNTASDAYTGTMMYTAVPSF